MFHIHKWVYENRLHPLRRKCKKCKMEEVRSIVCTDGDGHPISNPDYIFAEWVITPWTEKIENI